ncbi:MAG: type III-A CRISPR-associated RAMP protein Csm5 [Candidatus Cloacimonadaceae bacterium]
MKNIIFPMQIKLLSYLHIGSGEKLDPTDYVIKDGKIYYLNKLECIRQFLKTDKNRFQHIMQAANQNKIALYFYDNFNPDDSKLWTSFYKTDIQIENSYLENLKKENNQNLIAQFIRDPLNDMPYLPGSSIKGSFRTAIVAALKKGNRLNSDKDDILQASLLGYFNEQRRKPDITNDPFKYLKFADVPLSLDCLTLKVTEVKKKGIKVSLPHYSGKGLPTPPKQNLQSKDNKTGIPETTEVIDYHNASVYEAKLTIADSIFNDKKLEQLTGKTSDWKWLANLLKSVNTFYQTKLSGEKEFFQSLNKGSFIDNLEQEFSKLQEGECIIRMGKGAGRRFLTYLDNRIKDPLTRKVIGNEPLGWCKISFTK